METLESFVSIVFSLSYSVKDYKGGTLTEMDCGAHR